MNGVRRAGAIHLHALRRGPLAAAAAISLVGAEAAAKDGDAQSSGSAHAVQHQRGPGQLGEGRWSLDAGAGLMLSLSSVEERDDDVFSSSKFGFGEVALSARYRIAEPLGVGVRASWGTDLGQRGVASSAGESVDFERSLSQIALAARYQATRGRSWALGGGVGAAALSDRLGGASVTQWAPLAFVSVGYDLPLAAPFALGIELRASHARFSDSGRPLGGRDRLSQGSRSFRYGPTGWVGVHVVGRWLP